MVTGFLTVAPQAMARPPEPTTPVSPPSRTPSDGPLFVALDQQQYRVELPASSFRVSIVLAPVPGAGIVSYGVTLKFDANAFELGRPGVEIPAGLNFNGFNGPGAFVETGPGYASFKGTVDLLNPTAIRYDAPLVASVLLSVRDAEPGDSAILSLEPFFTAGPEEDLFVDGDGRVLDPDLVFRSATVEFVPEPGATSLLALGWMIWLVSPGSRRLSAPTPSMVGRAAAPGQSRLSRRFSP